MKFLTETCLKRTIRLLYLRWNALLCENDLHCHDYALPFPVPPSLDVLYLGFLCQLADQFICLFLISKASKLKQLPSPFLLKQLFSFPPFPQEALYIFLFDMFTNFVTFLVTCSLTQGTPASIYHTISTRLILLLHNHIWCLLSQKVTAHPQTACKQRLKGDKGSIETKGGVCESDKRQVIESSL